MIWITGYVGSGKSTISKNIKNCYEFDEIEDLMNKNGIKFQKENFKKVCRDYLRQTNVKIFNGIQAVDYYKKGDKVFFVKTNFFTSTFRSIKRDTKKRLLNNLKDNITLFFKIKILYIKASLNHDIIKNIDYINKL